MTRRILPTFALSRYNGAMLIRSQRERFTAPIATEGRYQVYLYWPRSEGLATRAPVSIRHSAGTALA